MDAGQAERVRPFVPRNQSVEDLSSHAVAAVATAAAAARHLVNAGRGPERRPADGGTDDLMRREHHKRLAARLLLANAAPALYFVAASADAWAAHGSPLRWSPLQLHKLLCGCLCTGLLALAALTRASERRCSEAAVATLLRLEVRPLRLRSAAPLLC
jgi:hypothetical protein